MTDPFLEYYAWYPDFHPVTNPIPRPQPIDAVLEFFHYKHNGVFVDVGAYDGITWSNSLPLEKYYGWKGICIEPIPEVFEKMKNVRTSACVQSAVTDFDGEVDFIKVEGYAEMLSGIIETMNVPHRERIESEIKAHGGRQEIVKLKAEKLQSILDRFSYQDIDYLSIDVECGEMKVLSGVDWSRTNISLISCEVNRYFDGQGIFSFMQSIGYTHLGRVCGDEFFAKQR